jgi:UDP-2,4-diacetamido-2,4,6-trideoxy-beta-L-altropyranose hydrolase
LRKSPTLLIRADASSSIGSGHVMRCLALAKAWQGTGGPVCYLAAENIPTLEERLARENVQQQKLEAEPGTGEDAQSTVRCANRLGADWVVVDGYQFGPKYIGRLKAAGLKVLALDDDGRFDFYGADVVLNQNIGATNEKYERREAFTRLLLGAKYVLLRPEFLSQPHEPDISGAARKLLVTMGGADSEGVTSNVLRALLRLKNDFEAVVVVGGGNPHRELLQAQAAKLPGKFRIERDPADMARLMRWANLAISAAGGTCWELAFLGVPMALIVLSNDQTENAAALSERGAALNMGWHGNLAEDHISSSLRNLMDDAPMRRAMSQRAQQLIDGRGAARVVEFLQSSL